MSRARALDPEDPDLLTKMSILYHELGWADEAEQAGLAAAQLRPLSSRVWRLLARQRRLRGRYDASLAALRHATSIDPASADLWRETAEVAVLAGKALEARSAQARAEQLCAGETVADVEG